VPDPVSDVLAGSVPVTRRTLLKGVAAGALLATLPGVRLPARAAGLGLTAGTGRADITPGNGGEFFGYVRPDMRADGVALRLFAHALVLDDGERKVALVSVDLGAPHTIRARVLEHVRPLGFDADTVLLAATHTHAGPDDMGDWTAQQVAAAIAQADAARAPAVAGWGRAEVTDANRCRSIEAHLANHGLDLAPGFGSVDLDPDGPDHSRDLALRLLRVDHVGGRPLAAWAHFSVHPTCYIPSNTTFSADCSGSATRRFEAGFHAGEAPFAMFTNGNEGDLIPLYDDYNQHAVSDRVGLRIARGMRAAWEAAGDDLGRTLVVDGRAATLRYEGQEAAPGKPVANRAMWGVPFLGGAQNGPSPFYEAGLEGKRRPAALADPVHGRKIIAGPAPWPSATEVQALRVGEALLLGVPGEPTVETGRHIRAAVLAQAPADTRDAMVVGLANGFHGYFTTPAEYDQQHYEGGHTVFGKWSMLPLVGAHADLAGALAAGLSGGRAPAGSAPAEVAAPVGAGADGGSWVEGPRAEVERMTTVACSWDGGAFGRDRPVDAPFVRVERRAGGGWEPVEDDLGWGIVWQERLGRYTARYDAPIDLPTGTYRFRITAARYTLASSPFEVVPSTGLRLLGVVRRGSGAGRLVFGAQHPPPDPERDLRTRELHPTGGSVRFRVADRWRTATWDGEHWSVPAGRVGDGDRLEDVLLVDGHGNTSGTGRDLVVGEVEEVVWPPAIGPAGGRSPGPAGIGTFPP
jgi:neutral ceramidase